MIPHRLIELAQSLETGPLLVTGARGGIGQRLVEVLARARLPVRVLLRRGSMPAVETVMGDLTRPEDLTLACSGIHTILHLASHSPAADDPDPEAHPLHAEVTVKGTRNLLQAAETAGVGRLVFASSTRVLDNSDTCYARSKQKAEALLAQSALATTSLRLPPVYGFVHRGFVAQLLAKARAGRLPPLPDFGDRRSLLHLDDAVQALLLAAGCELEGEWTVTDLQDYSIQRITHAVEAALGQTPRRPWPPALFRGAALAGELLQRLSGRPLPLNLQRLEKLQRSAWFDGAPFAAATGFQPLYTLESALPLMVAKLAQEAAAS